MQRPSPEGVDAYCQRFQVTPEVAWRDYLQLRLAEATSRDPTLKEFCIWKGAFVMRFVLESARASGDVDATGGKLRKHDIDPQRMYQRLKKACEDLGIELPRPEPVQARDNSVTFDPIVWQDAEVGRVTTSIDLSLREDLVLPPQRRTITSGLTDPFEVLHVDLNEQAAEKMRCLAQRSKVGDGWDVTLLWRSRADLDAALIRRVVPKKLTSGKDHKQLALDGIDRRYEIWDRSRGQDLPREGGPTKQEMRDACRAAVHAWIP